MEDNELLKLKERISQSGLFISRVPEPTKILFKKIAEEQWSNDYGMFLTYLIKFYLGECSSGHEEINAKLDLLASEIEKLKEVKEEPKEEKRKSLLTRRLEKMEELKNGKVE